MGNILFLLGAYEPAPKANGICCEAVIRALKRRGHNVDIIAFAPEQPYAPEAVVSGVPVYYINGPMYYRVSRHEELKSVSGGQLKAEKILLRLSQMVLAWNWPHYSPLATQQFYQRAKALHEKKGYDIIIGTFSPFSALYAAAKLKKKCPEIKMIAYFLDALSGGVAPKVFSKDMGIRMGLRWEKRILHWADRVVIMQSHEEHHKRYSREFDYFDRLTTLDIPLLELSEETGHSKHESGLLHIVYVGAVRKDLKNPAYILELVKRMNAAAVWDFYGTIDCPELFDELVSKGKVRLHGEVAHMEAIKAQREADFLLNIGSNNVCQIPCKIFEYISTGKPIITTCPIENEPSLPYLRKYGVCFVVNENWDAVEETAQSMQNFIMKYQGYIVNTEQIRREFRRNRPAAFADVVEDVMKE